MNREAIEIRAAAKTLMDLLETHPEQAPISLAESESIWNAVKSQRGFYAVTEFLSMLATGGSD